MRLAWNLLDCAIVNAFKYREAQAGKLHVARDQRHFRETLRDELIADHSYRKKAGRPAQPSDSVRYDGRDHLIIEPEARSVRVCADDACSTRTIYMCSKCDVNLCVSCFFSYHKQ